MDQGRALERHGQEAPTVALAKPIQQADNTAELLLLTLQQAMNLKPNQVQELLTNQNQYFLQACDNGFKGDFRPVVAWFELLHEFNYKIISLFQMAYSKNAAVEVTLVLSSIRCGLYSQNQKVSQLALSILNIIADGLYDSKETFLQKNELPMASGSKKKGINEVTKIPIFRFLQDWFLKSKKIANPMDRYQSKASALAQAKLSQGQGDPQSVLRAACTDVLDSHPQLAHDVARLVLSIFRESGEGTSVFLRHLPDMLQDIYQDDIFLCYEALSNILPEIDKINTQTYQNLLGESNLLSNIMNLAGETNGDHAVRLQTTSLIIDVWNSKPQIVQAMTSHNGISVRERALEMVRQGLSHKDKVFRLAIFSQAFGLLDYLVEKRNSESPHVFKLLVTVFFDLLQGKFKTEKLTQELVLCNFQKLFASRADVPINVMVEHFVEILIARLKSGENKKASQITSTELQFIFSVTSHPKLSDSSIILIVELLATIYFIKPMLARIVLKNLTDIICKNQVLKQVINFTSKTIVPKALTTIMSTKKDELMMNDQGPKRRVDLLVSRKSTKQNEKSIDANCIRKIVRNNVVELLKCLYDLQISEINDDIVVQIKACKDKYNEVFKTGSTAYAYLMELWGLTQEQQSNGQEMALVISDQHSEQALALISESQQRVEDYSSMKQKIRELEKLRSDTKERQKAIQWQEAKDPTNKIALRAVEKINEIKENRLNKQNQDRIEEVKKQEKQVKLHEESATEVLIRKILLEKEQGLRKKRIRELLGGAPPQEDPYLVDAGAIVPAQSNPYCILLDNPMRWDATPQSERQMNQKIIQILRPKDGIQLVNFEADEEDRHRDGVRLLVNKYQNLFKYFFDRYTAVSGSVKRKGSLELVSDKTIKFGECQRFLKEHGLDNSQLSQKELATLMTMINNVLLTRHGADALEYPGFVQLILQSSITVHKKGRVKDISVEAANHMTHAQMVQHQLDLFREAAHKRGENMSLYDTPQAMTASGVIDQEKAKLFDQLNNQPRPKDEKGKPSKLASLPAGFMQSKEQQQIYTYKIPEQIRLVMGPPKCVALEILDSLLVESVGIHLFEGECELKEMPCVRLHDGRAIRSPTPSPPQSPIKSKSSKKKDDLRMSADQSQEGDSKDKKKGNESPKKGAEKPSKPEPSPKVEGGKEKGKKEDAKKADQKNVKAESGDAPKKAAKADPKAPKEEAKADPKASKEETKAEPKSTKAVKGKKGEEQPEGKPPAKDPKVKDSIDWEKTPLKPKVKQLPDWNAYHIDTLVQQLLQKKKITVQNEKIPMKQMRENELFLMGTNWSSEIKVACYELSNYQPHSKLNDMREVAQTLEDMLQSIQGGYKYGRDQKQIKIRRKTVPSVSIRDNKLDEAIIKRSEIQKREEAENQAKKEAKDLAYLKRGVMLKEKLVAVSILDSNKSVDQLTKKEVNELRAKQIEISELARQRKQESSLMEKISRQKNEEQERKLKYQQSDKAFIKRNQQSVAPYFRSNSGLISEDKATLKIPRRGASNVTLTPLSAEVVKSPDVRKKVNSSALTVRPNETRMVYLQFYLQPNVQQIYKTYETDLQTMFKQKCVLTQVNQAAIGQKAAPPRSEAQDVVRLKQEGFESLCEAADIKGSAEVFQQICREREIQDTSLSLEEFKKSLIRLAVKFENVPVNLEEPRSLEYTLNEQLIGEGLLDQFLGYFTKAVKKSELPPVQELKQNDSARRDTSPALLNVKLKEVVPDINKLSARDVALTPGKNIRNSSRLSESEGQFDEYSKVLKSPSPVQQKKMKQK